MILTMVYDEILEIKKLPDFVSLLNLNVAGDIIQKIYLGYNADNHCALLDTVACICWE